MLKSKTNNAFTLSEALLSIALIGILASISAPLYTSLLKRNYLNIAAVTLGRSLRQAQIFSQGVTQDSSWGVKVQNGSIVVFKGTDFILDRDPNFDETYDMSPAITTSGSPITEIVFQKLSGEPVTYGTIILNGANGETKTVMVNEKGMIEY